MHGLGNDYVYIDCLDAIPSNLPELAIEMSRPHTGIGSDGIILICRSDLADFKMRIFNADGSEAKMCGNGARCVGKYVYDHRLTERSDLTLETLGGIKRLHLYINSATDEVERVSVDMGAADFRPANIPVDFEGARMVDEPVATRHGTVGLTAVSMGNPHGVVFTDSLDSVDVHSLGAELERHRMWPDRANIEFAQVVSDTYIIMRVWERGSGETMACGTGACAVAAAAALTGRTGKSVDVRLPGGTLHITIEKDGHVTMTGPATTVFEGRYKRQNT